MLRYDSAKTWRASSGCSKRDLALGFLLRNLAEDVLGEMMLEFAERGHAIVDPVEQQQDGDAGERAAAEADEQALEQARDEPTSAPWPFP